MDNLFIDSMLFNSWYLTLIISIKIKIRAKAIDGRFEEKKRGENDAKHPTKIWINFLLKLEVVVFLLKKNLLSSNRTKVLQSSTDSQAAQEELLELITNHLEEYHSDKYDFDGKIIHVKATKESVDLLNKDLVPIETASLLVQEDLILMNPRGDEFCLEAASLSAPSHWSLTDKFSKNLMNVHEGVPSYKEKIGNRSSRFK